MDIPDSISQNELLHYLHEQKYKQTEITTAMLEALEHCEILASIQEFHELDRRRIFSKVQDLFYKFS